MKLLLIILFVFKSFVTNAQVNKYTILDNQTSQHIPYATIKFKNKFGGVITDQYGSFNLTFQPLDTIIITSISYDSLVIPATSLTEKIYLTASENRLPTVTVNNYRFGEHFQLGWKGDNKLLDYPFVSSNSTDEFAQKINLPNQSNYYLLSKVIFPIYKGKYPTNLILHIYKTDSLTGLPGEEIFQKLLPVSKLNRELAQINLSIENILLGNVCSFFVGTTKPPSTNSNYNIIRWMFSTHSAEPLASRTLNSLNYNWFSFGKINMLNSDKILKLGGSYTIEVVSLK